MRGRYDPSFTTREVPGVGIESGLWRLGRGDGDTVYSFNNQVLARFNVREKLRPGAAEQVRALRDDGYGLWLVSGDARERVTALADRLGLDAEHVRAAQRPKDKAALVERLDAHDTLFLGDGVNDAPAFAKALVAGTPAIDRPVMPSRSSFFFVGEGLSALSEALKLSRRLHQVVRSILFVSIAYNVMAVTAGLCGVITPLRAAVFMPLSSLSLLAFTLWALRERRTPQARLVEVPA
jgi:Cu2+-exporting ATPase